jgi:2-polyprenyl-3-methyl-5-hydroxy-6-metoxy-1,4-benzoquinol methylase
MHYRASPLDYSAEQSFPIVICPECGYGKTEDILQKTDSLYVGGCYDEKEKPWHKLIRPLMSILEHGKLRYFASDKIAGKRLLEIGCGKGLFLEAAKKRGFRIYGIEPSPRSFSFAAARLGNSIVPIGLEDIDKVSEFPNEYDYVMLWHVLEHLNDPGATLTQIKERLAGNGRVVIAVPNFASFQARCGKADWYHLDPPRHVHHFTPVSLRIVAVENGFEVEKIFFNSFYQNFVGELVTIVNKALPGKNVIFNELKLNRAYLDRFGMWGAWTLFILGSAMSALIALPVLVVTGFNQLIGQAGTMVVILKRTDSK